MAHAVIWLTLLFLVVALLWSYLSKVDVIVSAPGVLKTRERPMPVVTTAEAKVTLIKVKEGEQVKAGQLLAVLESRTTARELASVSQSEERTERVRREVAADLPAERGKLLESIEGERKRIQALKSSLAQVEREKALLAEDRRLQLQSRRLQAPQLQEQLRKAKLQVEQADRNVEFARDNLATNLRLSKKGLVSKLRITELEKITQDASTAASLARAGVRELKAQIVQEDKAVQALEANLSTRLAAVEQREQDARAQIQSAQARMGELEHELTLTRSRARSKVEAAEEEMRRIKSETVSSQNQGTQLLAPVAGRISGLSERVEGIVLKPGEPLCRIIPEGAPLVVEARVANRDMGFVKEGLTTKIRFEAFPREKYGALTGKVLRVSPDALEDPKNGYVYLVESSLQHQFMEGEGRQVELFSGLQAQVEIVTRRERVLDMVLKPFYDLGEQISVGK